jgi:CRP-like cAMP-binding protein
MSPAAMTAVVFRRLNALKPLSPGQAQRIGALGERLEAAAPGAMLQSEGDGLMRPTFILSGWACRQRLLPDGRRQIFSILIPGDAVGFCSDPSPISSASAVALTKVALATVEPLSGGGSTSSAPPVLGASDPWGFAEHMRLSACLEEGLLLDHIVRLGRQTAYERTAHLLLELHWRLALIGRADGRSFSMPLTQEVLADFLGLSIVHVNRTLQQLRRERLIEISGSNVTLVDVAQLKVLSDYQPPSLAPGS